MPTFRILDQRPVYLDLAGNLANGGSLKFYETGTTTPKDVYADPDKSVNNGSTVTLGSDGRSAVDIWGDGAYRVRLYDADGTLVSEADYVEIPGGTGTTIPALVSGQFLTNDGAVLQWGDIRQVPDPTGSADKILSNDGSNLIWIAQPTPPTPPDPDITVSDTGAAVGDGTLKFAIQTGTDSAPTSSARTTSKNISFPTAFTKLMHVSVTQNVSSVGTYGIGATVAVTGFSPGSASTGCTATFNSADDGGDSGYTIINPIPFTWVAFGLILESDSV